MRRFILAALISAAGILAAADGLERSQ